MASHTAFILIQFIHAFIHTLYWLLLSVTPAMATVTFFLLSEGWHLGLIWDS